MAARFDPAVEVVLSHEGGLSDHVADPGGLTNWGISIRFARAWLRKHGKSSLDILDIDGDGDVDADDIRAMPRERAIEVYRRAFWDAYAYHRIADQAVATKLFDSCVNLGPGRAHLLAQFAASACGKNVEADGVLGPLTVRAINACEPVAFLRAYVSEQANLYLQLIDSHPGLAVFRNGWMRRASWPLPPSEGAA